MKNPINLIKNRSVNSIDGQTLKKYLISASNNLFNHYPEVDALNVFPVPDGDTGINMNLTMTSGANEIANIQEKDCFHFNQKIRTNKRLCYHTNTGNFKQFIINL